jgi:hypothetical protein
MYNYVKFIQLYTSFIVHKSVETPVSGNISAYGWDISGVILAPQNKTIWCPCGDEGK